MEYTILETCPTCFGTGHLGFTGQVGSIVWDGAGNTYYYDDHGRTMALCLSCEGKGVVKNKYWTESDLSAYMPKGSFTCRAVGTKNCMKDFRI